MDDRQRQIREGAGLAESRLNEEFIEFLQKWSMPLLVAIAVIAVGYTVYGKMQKARTEKVDLAFQELDAAASTANPNPESLERIAEEYSGIGAVPLVARLAAADSLLRTVRSGIKPGAQLKPDASLASPDDALTEQDRDLSLNRAREYYQQAFDQASRNESQKPLTITALYGLAAVAECRKELDAARVHYEKIISICENTGFVLHATLARARLDSLNDLTSDVKLYNIADLAPIPEPPSANTPAPDPAPTTPIATDEPKPEPKPDAAPETKPDAAGAGQPTPPKPADAPESPAPEKPSAPK